MLQQKPNSGQPLSAASSYDHSRFADVALVLGVVGCAALIEISRRTGFSMPVPFLLLYGSVTLAAGLAGRRTGLVAAAIASVFVIHCSSVDYGPPSLTGGPVQASLGIIAVFAIAILIGGRRDTLLYLAKSLEAAQRELIDARDVLAQRAERRAVQLEDATTELVDVRMQLENTMRYSPFAVMVFTDDFRITSVNPAALKLFGLKSLPPEWANVAEFMQHIRFYSEEGHEVEVGEGPLYQALIHATITDDYVCRILLPNKTERWLRGSFAPIRTQDGNITGVTAIFIDISDKMHANSLMKDLVSRVLKAHEDDRSVIAHRLQDDIGQHLVATKINLHSAAQTGNYEDPVRDTIGRIDTLMNSVRDWSLELRPAALDDLGLVSALRWFLTNQQRNFGFEIDFDTSVENHDISPEIEIACFRIAQQAVANVLDHANAESIKVRLYNRDNRLCLAIIDDGCGFEVERAMLGQSEGGGLGMITMRERAIQVGGEFNVVSAPGLGTTITVCFPNR